MRRKLVYRFGGEGGFVIAFPVGVLRTVILSGFIRTLTRRYGSCVEITDEPEGLVSEPEFVEAFETARTAAC